MQRRRRYNHGRGVRDRGLEEPQIAALVGGTCWVRCLALHASVSLSLVVLVALVYFSLLVLPCGDVPRFLGVSVTDFVSLHRWELGEKLTEQRVQKLIQAAAQVCRVVLVRASRSLVLLCLCESLTAVLLLWCMNRES